MGLLRNLVVFVVGLLAGRKFRSERGRRATKELRKREKLPFWLRGWKGFLKRLAFAVPFLALGGFLLAASGIVPIKASSGHFAITAWFLEFSLSRSVSTHSMGIKSPPLDSEALAVKGGGHYETGCRPCHGGVSDVTPQIPQQMTPHPPKLPAMIPKWDPEELFYIAKHGVKFTGMPAFPSLERDDEVWAVVAFLLRLPDMDVPEYQRLVYGEGGAAAADAAPITGLPTGGEPVLVRESCRRCHGEGGRGREQGAFPRLAGQRPNYIYAALFAYASGERHSGMMEPIAAGMTADEMREIALYYAQAEVQPALRAEIDDGGEMPLADDTLSSTLEEPGLQDTRRDSGRRGLEGTRRESGRRGLEGLIEPKTWAQEARHGDEFEEDGDRSVRASIERGRAIAQYGIPEQMVPSCRDCHGPNRIRTNPFYPVLAGQFAEYLVLQLELFKTEHRGGSPYAHLMRRTADRLTAGQMRDVALFYESLGDGPVSDLDPYIESLVATDH